VTSDRLTRWLATGGNAAVVVGLLLLVYELNQTRELTRAQMRSEISSGIYDLLAMSANYFQYASRTRAMFRYFENVHYQYRVGLYDDGEFERQKIAWANYLNGSARAPKIWCDYQHVVSVEFAAELNTLLNNEPCD
jgi:hypothetical protein